MTRAASIYTLNLPANGTREVLADAGMYKILSQTAPVRVSRDGNTIGPMLAGQGERENFTRISVTDLSGAANTVTVLVADRQFIDERIYGEVSNIDGGLVRTLNLTAFSGSLIVAALAGNYSHVQLYNQGANSKNVVISKIHFSSITAAPNPYIVRYATQLVTNAGNVNSKRLGGAQSTAELRSEQNVAVLQTGGAHWSPFLTANEVYTFEPKEPLLLVPGMGCNVVNAVVNAQLSVSFDFYEYTP